MSSDNYSNLSNLSKETLINMVITYQQNDSHSNESILSRRNKSLTEENSNYRKEIGLLNSFRMQYYNLKSSIDNYKTNISQLKHENNQLKQQHESLNDELNQTQQFKIDLNQNKHIINQLKSQNQSLKNQLQTHTNKNNQLKQLQFQMNTLQQENKNLQDDLLREERLHSNKYENICGKLNEYERKYKDLLQRYSSMETFVEEYCDHSNFEDENNDTIIQQLTKWTQLLKYKQENMVHEINNRVTYRINDITNTLQHNTYKMNIYKKEVAHNIVNNVLNDIICNVVVGSNEYNMDHKCIELNRWSNKLLLEEKSVNSNKRLMESQITQLNGQKQIIINLNKTIQDLYSKVREYEHHIHRLTFQLKQLSLINKAQIENDNDFNIKQIKDLSGKLIAKEIEYDQLKNKMEIKEEFIKDLNSKMNELENGIRQRDIEYNNICDKYNELKGECKQLEMEYGALQGEYENVKNQLLGVNNGYRDIETENGLLKNKMDIMVKEYNKLKQNEYNYKLLEKELKDKYKANYDKFGKLNVSLQRKIEQLESGNKGLQKEVEQYHNGMIKQREYSKDVNSKYNQLKYEYDKLKREYNQIKDVRNRSNTSEVKFQEYENKIKELMKQIQMYKYNNNNNNNSNNESLEIQNLKNEINNLQDQLYEGSNIRRELRTFITKYQREGQMKLNKNYKKLTFMKNLLRSTYTILYQQKEFINKNNSLRQHMDYLRNTLQENQENNIENINVTNK
eukprot:130263_1